ncbi:venom carboxylesterase-6-like isoform X1 [Contarinia nasturtii]|uniref:venom carboxylesterase-6-like isoform X1 n=1 Tax=Contarinia nasturtii TaxID=265458 RepID=UPI0012D4315A|nr:venom carboxylesterase-6-like isoform X1 [Contarinia nasturtii]
MNNSIVLTLLLSCCTLVWSRTSSDLRVTLSNGSKLIGKYSRSFSGRPIKSFVGVPYAKPPVGHLRFKAPEPIEKWDGEYKAINDGSVCVQRNSFKHIYDDQGSENCLFLNVHVPHSFEGISSNLSVMVYFHGGGFITHSGTSSFYGPTYLLDHDIILVTANYRLGPLGFLSTEDENCLGNFGLKDQSMVLKWIQQNIERFGGNPNSVTIFGSSAGGASVTYHMMSPLSKGLFSRAIAMSGTNLAPWAQPAHKGVARKQATKFAKYFNCYTPSDWPLTIDCLRNVPAINISAAFFDFFEFDTDPMVVFSPVVEPDVPGAFITKHPREDKAETSKEIPFLAGATYDEGLIKSLSIFNYPGAFDNFASNLTRALSISLYYDHHNSSIQDSITKHINEFYFENNFSRDKFMNVTNLFGDAWFLDSMDSYVRMRLAHKEVASNYVYLLSHKASASLSDFFHGDTETIYGVCHGDEGIYLFPHSAFSNSLPTKGDEEMRRTITQLWVDFARNGNPTPDSSHLPKWTETKELPLNFYRLGNLHFDGKPMFGNENGGIFEERAKFWREINAFTTNKN